MTELSVIIPTRDRVDVLLETLKRLAAQQTARPFEVIVVDDGSAQPTAAAARRFAEDARLPVTTLQQDGRGPAAARNRGLAAARGTTCLFMGDDTFPRPDLVERHATAHERRPEPQAAVLGHVTWAPECRPTPFMDWLNTSVQFDFEQITDPGDVPGSCFYTANVSAKRAFLSEAGGFDEAFPHAAFEDIELGLRLDRLGMRLIYDAEAVVEHFHPYDLRGSLRRMRVLGRSAQLLHDRCPQWPLPRRSGSRHVAKAVALTMLNAIPRVHPSWLRHATWHFLCHQAFREGCWGEMPRENGLLRLGGVLAALAARDPATHRLGDVQA